MNKIPIIWPAIDGHAGADAVRVEWTSIVSDYEDDPANVYLGWLYLGHHPMFWDARVARNGGRVEPILDFSSAWGRRQSLEVTMSQDGDGLPVVTLELEPLPWHDDTDVPRIQFDGATFETVVIDAARRVHDMFGNDREFLAADTHDGRWYG